MTFSPRVLTNALLAGLLFGSGLVVSGMTDPQNVLAFLDVAGDWQPGLAIVMGTAIAVAAPAFAIVRRRGAALNDAPVTLANRAPVDRALLAGAAIFGIGWGMVGICPGPGLILAASGNAGAMVFVGALIAGSALAAFLQQRLPITTGDYKSP